VRLGVEHRRIAVADLVGHGDLVDRQPVHLGQDAARGVEIDVLVLAGAEDLVPA
jgi:hypothetical protein